MAKTKKKKLPLAYQPVGFVLSWAGGALAGMAFRKAWMAIRHGGGRARRWTRTAAGGEILLAAAVQGAIFAVVRSAVDRTGAKAIARSTGVWPVTDKKGRD
ncbi:DUF4235 domain-containing protein [Streptomyces tricolor]|nr:DUF4235 domain-containing protein [Streptomyces tricolor]